MSAAREIALAKCRATIASLRAAPVPPLAIRVFDGAFIARADELGAQLGLARADGETYVAFAARLVAAQRQRAPRIAGLLA